MPQAPNQNSTVIISGFSDGRCNRNRGRQLHDRQDISPHVIDGLDAAGGKHGSVGGRVGVPVIFIAVVTVTQARAAASQRSWAKRASGSRQKRLVNWCWIVHGAVGAGRHGCRRLDGDGGGAEAGFSQGVGTRGCRGARQEEERGKEKWW